MSNPNFVVGASMRDFAYYGTPVNNETVQFPADLRRLQIDELAGRLGGRVVRFWASHVSLTADECISHVRVALDQLWAAGLQAVVCLDDSLGVSGFYIKGTESFHTETSLGHLHKRCWNDPVFLSTYRNHITQVVGALGQHPGVWMWEAGNEYTVRPTPQTEADADAFLLFVRTFSSLMRSLTDKPISTGLISTRHVFRDPLLGESDDQYNAARKAYALALHETLDAASLHYYRGDSSKDFVDFDVAVLREVKPFYVGELGAPVAAGDRPPYYAEEIRQRCDEGAHAVLVWGFSCQKEPADNTSVSRKWNDYDQITGTMATYARPAPAPLKPSTTDVLHYVNDQTIPDHTVFVPNEPLPEKIWRIRNTGTSTWGDGYELVHTGGDSLGASLSVPLPALAPGEEGTVTVRPLAAPPNAGSYTSLWTPRNAQGELFRAWLSIVIDVRVPNS